MSKTLLDGINDLLDRVGILDANGTLGSLTNAGKQLYIDRGIQIWNETVDHVCNMMGEPHPGETGSSSITLVTDTREYDLPSDLIQIRWPLINQTDGHYIYEYCGGYEAMRIEQSIPDEWDGLPMFAVINPTTGKLRVDRNPTATDNGAVYNMLYDKDLVMDAANDTFPFTDATYRAILPVVAEGWERITRNDFDEKEYNKHLSRALAMANKINRRPNW